MMKAASVSASASASGSAASATPALTKASALSVLKEGFEMDHQVGVRMETEKTLTLCRRQSDPAAEDG